MRWESFNIGVQRTAGEHIHVVKYMTGARGKIFNVMLKKIFQITHVLSDLLIARIYYFFIYRLNMNLQISLHV